MMKDEIVIAEALDGQVRIHAARTTAMCEEARITHHCMPTSAAALGRVLTVTGLMASDLKDPKAKITSVFNGHGPAGTVLAQGDGAGHVRGFISDPNLYMVRKDGHLDVGKAVGTNGTLTVIKDLGLKEPFSGVVNLQTGEIGDDYAYYFALSEQVRSVVAVGVLVSPDNTVKAGGGMIYQLMPEAAEDAIEYCEHAAKTMKPMTEMADSDMSVEQMILSVFPDARILEHLPIQYYCGCSRDHYREALATLPLKDLKELVAENKPAEIVCQYCGKKYEYSPEELQKIVDEKVCGTSAVSE